MITTGSLDERAGAAAGRPCRPGLHGPQPPARPCRPSARRGSSRSATPTPRCWRGDRPDGRHRLERLAGDGPRGGRSTPWSSPRRPPPTSRWRWRRSSAGSPSSSRSRWRRPRPRRSQIVRAARARGVPVQVGPRGALQPGRPRARAAPARPLADHRLLHRQPARGAVSRPRPRRRRDGRPGHPRRRHAVLDRRRAAHPRLRRAGEAEARVARGPALRPAPLPVRGGRDARRELAHPGQAPPAGGGGRGGDVRAGLPHPAADVHDVGPRPPGADRRLRADVRRGRRGDPRPDPRAARGPARRRSSGPSGRGSARTSTARTAPGPS